MLSLLRCYAVLRGQVTDVSEALDDFFVMKCDVCVFDVPHGPYTHTYIHTYIHAYIRTTHTYVGYSKINLRLVGKNKGVVIASKRMPSVRSNFCSYCTRTLIHFRCVV